jgi:DNA polymerase-3 subunit delta'
LLSVTANNCVGALPGIEAHPHARAVLTPALPPATASHAYLFHGPPGTGKRAVARAFASALLAEGSRDEAAAAARVARGTHPDLTWVRPSGAAEMLVSDIDEQVVAAASKTPFESRRRVFVIDGAEAMNDQTANRMLKTLEEPLPYVHLVLIADDCRSVLATIASRCQHVRFDPPPAEAIAHTLERQGVAGLRARACARLALGDGSLATWLADADGESLRVRIEAWMGAAIENKLDDTPWLGLLAIAKQEGTRAAEDTRAAVEEKLELLPAKERRRHAREGVEAERRAERRRRSGTLDLGLRLAELALRDAWCTAEGATDAVHAVDREHVLQGWAAGRPGRLFRGGVELVADTRLRLQLNVAEELALEVLSYRLAALLHS